jgi:hypothetical protein
MRAKKSQRALIEKWLERFPKDSTNWADAIPEIRQLSRESRDILEDYDGITGVSVNFNTCKTPAQWITKGRDSILANYDRMSEDIQNYFYDKFHEWFEFDEPKLPWAMKLMDGTILFFDTNEEMVAYSVKPEVNYQTMGKREYIAGNNHL